MKIMYRMFRFGLARLVCLALFLGLAAWQVAPAALALTPTPTAPARVVVTSTPAPTAGQATAQGPTTFSSDKFELPMTLVFGPAWSIEDNYPDAVTIWREAEDFELSFNLVNDGQLFDPATGARIPFPQDFATWLKNDPDFVDVATQPAKVAGVDGLQIDARAIWKSTTAHKKRIIAVKEFTWNLVTAAGKKWRAIMLDNVSGQRVLILMTAPGDKFDAVMPEARQILDNVKFARTAKVLAEWKLSMPQGFAFGFGSVWVPSHRTPNVTTRIDPTSNTVVAKIPTGFRNHDAIIAGKAVWTTGERDDMARIDPATNRVSASVPGGHTSEIFGFNSIWSATRNNTVERIDPATAKVIATIRLSAGVPDDNPELMVTASAVWVDNVDKQEVIKIDPKTNTIVSRRPYEQLLAEAQAQKRVPAGKGTSFVWLGLYEGLLRIDPITFKGVAFLPLTPEQEGGRLTITDDAVWLPGANGITRVDVATNQIDATYLTHPGPWALGLGYGSVWVAYEEDSLVQRLDIAP